MLCSTTWSYRKMFMGLHAVALGAEKTTVYKLSHSCRVYQRNLASLEYKRHHERMCHAFNLSTTKQRFLRQKSSSATSSTLSVDGSRRTMSILTDLLRRKKKDAEDEEDEVIPDAKILPLFDDSVKGLTEEEIEAKRNISRLSVPNQRLVHGQHPHVEPRLWIHHTVRYKQRMFGRYGESSGINPGLLWPTHEQLQEKIEYEEICNPFTIQELVEKKRALRQSEAEAREQRIKEVEAKMKLVDKFKDDLAKKQEAKERDALDAKEKREKLMEEVRRHFGYTVDSRDEKFQELLAKKEKEQRKNLKEARKLEKQQKILQKLEGASESKKTKDDKKKVMTENKDEED